MIITRFTTISVVIALLLLPRGPARAEPEPVRTETVGSAVVRTVEFMGESVGRTMRYNICLPSSYEESTDRYPVIYLLHGLTGSYISWSRYGVPLYAEQHDLIVVMPDAGNSWYVNWAQSDEGQKNDWEDFIVKDLIGHIDANYRTLAQREARAINGLSMGGYGALMLGLRHPNLFCSIGSHSGALGHAKNASERLAGGRQAGRRRRSDVPDPAIGVEGFSSQAARTPAGQAFLTADDADAYDPFKLIFRIPKDKLPHIYIDCGTEDGLIASSIDFIDLLLENSIPFTYAQSTGGHSPPYWTREVGHSIAVQHEIILRNLAQRKLPRWVRDPNLGRR